MPYIHQWLRAHDLGEIPATTVGYRGIKNVGQQDAFVDDKIKVLKALGSFVPHRMLLNRPYNLQESEPGIVRIDSLFEVEDCLGA